MVKGRWDLSVKGDSVVNSVLQSRSNRVRGVVAALNGTFAAEDPD